MSLIVQDHLVASMSSDRGLNSPVTSVSIKLREAPRFRRRLFSRRKKKIGTIAGEIGRCIDRDGGKRSSSRIVKHDREIKGRSIDSIRTSTLAKYHDSVIANARFYSGES